MVGKNRKTFKKTVYVDPETEQICTCSGDFWKGCPLRLVHDLPCKESIISITPIDRDDNDFASDVVRSLDPALKNLSDGLRKISKHLKP